jgi:hypothetical protein
VAFEEERTSDAGSKVAASFTARAIDGVEIATLQRDAECLSRGASRSAVSKQARCFAPGGATAIGANSVAPSRVQSAPGY